MNIYHRRDGRWEGRLSQGKKKNGTRKYKAVFGKTKEEVSRKMAKIRRVDVKPCSITVRQLFGEWHGSIKHKIKESTSANYNLKANKHILPAFGNKSADSIQGSEIYSFIESKQKAGLTNRYIADMLAVMKSMFKYAVRIYHIFNPMESIEMPSVKSPEITLLDEGEQAKLQEYIAHNQNLAHAYSKLYNIPSTGLRFFTVYGPAGRPDMAYFGFTNKLLKGETIEIFNYGNCKRDFTYVDDIVEGVKRVMMSPPKKKNGEDGLPIPPYAVYNIGNSNPENLLDFVTILQEELIRAKVLPEDYDFESHKKLVSMQPGDVPVTYADTSALERDLGFKPSTSLREGLRKFAEWYYDFYIKGET